MTTDQQDYDAGIKVLRTYWNFSKAGTSTFDEFLVKVFPVEKKRPIYIRGIGLGVNSSGATDSEVFSAMKKMAALSQGRIPSDYQVFFKFIGNETITINWISALAYTAGETGKTLLGGAEDLGGSLITSAKILNYILPIIVVGGVLLLVYSWINRTSGGDAAKLLKGLRK